MHTSFIVIASKLILIGENMAMYVKEIDQLM